MWRVKVVYKEHGERVIAGRKRASPGRKGGGEEEEEEEGEEEERRK